MRNQLVKKTIWIVSAFLCLGLFAKSQALALDGLLLHTLTEPPRNPLFYEGTLSIDTVDTPHQQGAYRSVLLSYEPEINAFKLIRVDESRVTEDLVEQVDLIMTKEQPIQAFLNLSGPFNPICGYLPVINQNKVTYADRPEYRLEFEISVRFYLQPLNRDEETSCSTEEKRYTFALPLSVYGLLPGNYKYIVNGIHTGTFEIKNVNVVPEILLKK